MIINIFNINMIYRWLSICRTNLFFVLAEFLVEAQEVEAPPAATSTRGPLGQLLRLLKENPDVRNMLTALLFGVGVFLFVMNIGKLAMPDDSDVMTKEICNEL